MSRRALRTQRKDVVEANRSGFEPVHIPHCHVDEDSFVPFADSPLPLSDGTQADPRDPWPISIDERK